MSVLLPNAQLSVKVHAHPVRRDAHGLPVMDSTTTDRGPYPGGVTAPASDTGGAGWSLRLDPAMWEVRPGDVVTDEQDRTWVIREARLVSVPGYDDVDFISALGDLDPPRTP